MSFTTDNNGRLCNQIIRNLAVSLLAEKYDLQVNYSSKDTIEELGIPLHSGRTVHKDTIVVNDDNYFALYNSGNIQSNLDPNNAYFQSKDISNFLYKYLHSKMTNVMSKNKFASRYNTNNDVFIHLRLTDVAHLNPGINYYLDTLQSIQFDNIFISTDDPSHQMIHKIGKVYPSFKMIHINEVETIHFGSTCKHVILSHGSFSGIIGYLSFFSNIHYPEYDEAKRWYGDMFSIPGWIKHKHL